MLDAVASAHSRAEITGEPVMVWMEAFAKAEPLFDIMGQKAVHCGAAGAGQAAKICNNMILGVTMIGTCEAFALADKLGLDPAYTDR